MLRYVLDVESAEEPGSNVSRRTGLYKYIMNVQNITYAILFSGSLILNSLNQCHL